MTVSGNVNFNPVGTFIITSALRKCGVINEQEVPTAGMFNEGMYCLNALVKEWMATGIHVWTEKEAILFFEPGQVRYLIGGTGSSIANTSDAYGYVLATLSSSAAEAATAVVLESADGISDGQNIGIVLDDGTTQWTTVNGTPSGDTVNLDDALTDSASSGNNAFVYTTKIVRPLKIPRARLLYYNGLLETPMQVLSRKEYMNYPNKTNPGTPTAFYYSPQLESGELYMWPAPVNSSYGCRFTWYRPLDDFTNAANTSDFPQEWINALTWSLAVELAPDFSVPPQRFAILKTQAAEKLELVLGWDRESEPIYFGMGFDEAQR